MDYNQSNLVLRKPQSAESCENVSTAVRLSGIRTHDGDGGETETEKMNLNTLQSQDDIYKGCIYLYQKHYVGFSGDPTGSLWLLLLRVT